MPHRKRYSSSFGHRYVASGGATSDGSPGSTAGVERKDGERSGGSSAAGGGGAAGFLGAPTDDDDISIFVQEIDARKPLASAAARQPLSVPSDVLSNKMPALMPNPGTVGRRVLEPFEAGASGSGSGSGADLGSAEAGAALGLGLVAGEHSRRTSEGMSASDGAKQSSTSMGPMLTREAEVDEKLKHMHEVFLASLEGLGSGGGRSGSGSGSASGVIRGEESIPVSRPSSRDGGAGGLGSGFPSGLGRVRRSGSLRSASAVEGGRQAGLSDRLRDMEGDSPRRRLYGE